MCHVSTLLPTAEPTVSNLPWPEFVHPECTNLELLVESEHGRSGSGARAELQAFPPGCKWHFGNRATGYPATPAQTGNVMASIDLPVVYRLRWPNANDRPNHFPLPDHRKTWWRWHGRGL